MPRRRTRFDRERTLRRAPRRQRLEARRRPRKTAFPQPRARRVYRTRLEKRFVQIDSDVLISHGPSSSPARSLLGGTCMLPGLGERRPFHLITEEQRNRVNRD